MNNKEKNQLPEQCVRIHFQYGLDSLDLLFALENKLTSFIESKGVGEFDGDKIAVNMKDGFLFMYGPDADKIFETILPVLQSSSFMNGASVTLRYGLPENEVEEKIIKISL